MVGKHLWLIAGWDPGHKKDGGDILADLWRLDLETWAWKQITPQVHASLMSQDIPPCCNMSLVGIEGYQWHALMRLSLIYIILLAKIATT